MNVGASNMTFAAKEVGMNIIPEGKCTFPVRVIQSYKPTAIVGSVFKLLHLARRMSEQNMPPEESSIERLVVGGENFAKKSRMHLVRVWGCNVYNTYGSTEERTMCCECTQINGLHVPEDLVHLDVYYPTMGGFVDDGQCGRAVLTTLLPVGEKGGNLLLNYDTEDTTVVLSRDRCVCGWTHTRIMNPQREAETLWIAGAPFNRVDVESSVFKQENIEYLKGEYEAFLYGGDDEGETIMRVSLECLDLNRCDKKAVEENFILSFFKFKPQLAQAYADGMFSLVFNFTSPRELELHHVKDRPKRLVDRRSSIYKGVGKGREGKKWIQYYQKGR